MDNLNKKNGFFPQMAAAGRIVLATLAICCFFYSLLILVIGQVLTPYTANGSLIRNEKGDVIGSELVAQRFSHPDYFWPRPSAVNYNAAASGGSNWSPTNPKLRERADVIIAKLGANGEKKVPTDLVTASGSGLDPQITLKSAEFQAGRIAATRGLPVAAVMRFLDKFAKRTGGPLAPESLVNVLLVNMALNLDFLKAPQEAVQENGTFTAAR